MNSQATSSGVISEALPLSFSQQSLWFWHQLHPESPLYNVPFSIHIKGVLSVEALEGAIQFLVQRHEILRTTYAAVNGQPVQQVGESVPLELQRIDLSKLSENERVAIMQRDMRRMAGETFDLEAGPIFQAALFQCSEEDQFLFWNIHHIAFDEWSFNRFIRELGDSYAAIAEGKPVPLQPLAIQYADFALWQQDLPETEVWKNQLEYWRGTLGGELQRVALPADRRENTVANFQGKRLSRFLSPSVTLPLKELSRQGGATLFVTLLAAFKVLLFRYTRQTELVVGGPSSGRTRLETEELLGYFVQMLPLRTRLDPKDSFVQTIQKVRSVVLGAFANQHIPIEKLAEMLAPERVAGENPFFNTIFSFENLALQAKFGGLEVTVDEIYNDTSKVDLNLTVRENAAGLQVFVEFSTSKFNESRMLRLLEHFDLLLQSISADPTQPIQELNLLGAEELNRVTFDWNQTQTDYPKRSLQRLFEEQVARTPQSIALIYDRQTIRYSELNSRANRLARFLQKEGLSAHSVLGIYLERSPEMIVAILAAVKAGAAYLPLDISYPVDRIRSMCAGAKAQLILTQQSLAAHLQTCETRAVILEECARKLASEPDSNLDIDGGPEDVAYIIYTSGSTGVPKGNVIPHRGVSRLLFHTNYVQLGRDERIAQISNASFDAATFEIWGALLFGGQLIGISKETALSPDALSTAIREQGITTLFLTSALFTQVAALTPDAFATVRNLLAGGDAVDPGAAKRILTSRAPQHLINGYGPTESTTFAVTHLITLSDAEAGVIPIGRPISNTTAYILEPSMKPAPVGIPGELYLGGDGLALGYVGRPDLTAERFVENPFGAVGTKLYRTGDLVRFREDGIIEFLGRTDFQVKIRGFRIELGEIETAIATITGIKENIVLAREDQPGDKRLVAYVCTASDSGVTEASLKSQLRLRLPEFMVPGCIVFLASLPLTANGKVDRRALPAPQRVAVGSSDSQLPRNNVELQLIRIWEAVLQMKPVGIHDNFFDLGGHSLLAIRLFAEIERRFEVKLPLAILFKTPTIEALARELASGGRSPEGSCIVEVQPKGKQTPIFWLHTLGGGGGGGLFTYTKLANALGEDRPSFGLVAPATPHETIGEMAAHYIRELRTRNPQSPYILAGYCFGGVIAYEMARQLEAAGEKVRLVLIDSTPPNVSGSIDLLQRESWRQLLADLAVLSRDVVGGGWKPWRERLERQMTKMKRRFSPAGSASEQVAARIDEFLDMRNYPADFKKTAETHWRALMAYRPGRYKGSVLLFRAKHRSISHLHATLGWSKIVDGNIEVIAVGGRHESVLNEPFVNEVAEHLRRVLE